MPPEDDLHWGQRVTGTTVALIFGEPLKFPDHRLGNPPPKLAAVTRFPFPGVVVQ